MECWFQYESFMTMLREVIVSLVVVEKLLNG